MEFDGEYGYLRGDEAAGDLLETGCGDFQLVLRSWFGSEVGRARIIGPSIRAPFEKGRVRSRREDDPGVGENRCRFIAGSEELLPLFFIYGAVLVEVGGGQPFSIADLAIAVAVGQGENLVLVQLAVLILIGIAKWVDANLTHFAQIRRAVDPDETLEFGIERDETEHVQYGLSVVREIFPFGRLRIHA